MITIQIYCFIIISNTFFLTVKFLYRQGFECLLIMQNTPCIKWVKFYEEAEYTTAAAEYTTAPVEYTTAA